jgi:hypothetical protein
MKKIMFVIVLLLVAGFAQADSWLEVEWAFQFGWIPYGAIFFYQDNSVMGFEPFNIIFKIDTYIYKIIKIGGSCTTDFNSTKYNFNFAPTGMTYLFYCGFEPIKGISINYEHSCSHPVAPYQNKNNGSPMLDAGYDRIYFELKGTVKY